MSSLREQIIQLDAQMNSKQEELGNMRDLYNTSQEQLTNAVHENESKDNQLSEVRCIN